MTKSGTHEYAGNISVWGFQAINLLTQFFYGCVYTESSASEKSSAPPRMVRAKRPVAASSSTGNEEPMSKFDASFDAVNDLLSGELELSMEKQNSAEAQAQVTHVDTELAIAAFACSEQCSTPANVCMLASWRNFPWY